MTLHSHQRFAFSRHTAVACPVASSHVSDSQPPAMNRRYLLFVLVDEPVRIPGEPGDAQPDSGGVTVLRPHPGAARPDGSPRILITSSWVIDSRWISRQWIPGLGRRIVMTCSCSLEQDM